MEGEGEGKGDKERTKERTSVDETEGERKKVQRLPLELLRRVPKAEIIKRMRAASSSKQSHY